MTVDDFLDEMTVCECGERKCLHRIGDDACPIIDGNDLSFSTTQRFRAPHEESTND